MKDYTSNLTKYVVVIGEHLVEEFASCSSLQFIGTNQAIISVDDYNRTYEMNEEYLEDLNTYYGE